MFQFCSIFFFYYFKVEKTITSLALKLSLNCSAIMKALLKTCSLLYVDPAGQEEKCLLWGFILLLVCLIILRKNALFVLILFHFWLLFCFANFYVLTVACMKFKNVLWSYFCLQLAFICPGFSLLLFFVGFLYRWNKLTK